MKNYALDARAATAHFPGIGRYVQALAHELPDLLQPGERLLLLRRPTFDRISTDPAAEETRFKTIHMPVSPFSLRQQWAVPRALNALRADLYHSPYYLMPYANRTPTVLTLYDLIPLRFPQFVSPRARLFFRLMTWLAMRTAAHVIAISMATQRQVMETFEIPARKISVIPLAVESRFCPQPEEEIQRVRNKYDLPAEYALYVGINKPHKNLTGLIEAWAEVRKDTDPRLDRLHLVLAGPRDARYPEPRAHIEHLGLEGSTYILGRLPDEDLPGIYTGATFFIFPSLFEGFGLPVIEAMACGTPVSCSRTPALVEVTRDAAIHFDASSVRSISAAIRRLAAESDLRDELKRRGMARARHYSWRHTAEQTLAIYRSLIP